MKRIPGPNDASAAPALADAMRRLREGKRGAPSADYRPPVSTFPLTPAAREALRLSRSGGGDLV